jgi:hypothetical protein
MTGKDPTTLSERCGYTGPADMIEKYPVFFWENVEPYIGDAGRMLGQERTSGLKARLIPSPGAC